MDVIVTCILKIYIKMISKFLFIGESILIIFNNYYFRLNTIAELDSTGSILSDLSCFSKSEDDLFARPVPMTISFLDVNLLGRSLPGPPNPEIRTSSGFGSLRIRFANFLVRDSAKRRSRTDIGNTVSSSIGSRSFWNVEFSGAPISDDPSTFRSSRSSRTTVTVSVCLPVRTVVRFLITWLGPSSKRRNTSERGTRGPLIPGSGFGILCTCPVASRTSTDLETSLIRW